MKKERNPIKMTGALFALLLMTALPSSLTAKNQNPYSFTDKQRAASGYNKTTVSGGKTDDKKGVTKDNYLDSVIYHDTFEMATDDIQYLPVDTKAKHTIVLGSPATDAAKAAALMLKKAQEEQKRIAAMKQKIPRYFVGGYCNMRAPVEISKSAEFSSVDCLLSFGDSGYRHAQVYIGLFPDYKRESVIGSPIYVGFDNGSRASFDGIVLTDGKGSLNLADWKDTKRIQQLLSEGMLATNDIVYRYASAYMGALADSRKKEQVEYVTTTDSNGTSHATPIKTTSSEKPRAKDFIIGAGLEILTNLFSLGGKGYLYATTPLFKIYGGKRIYVEGVISFDEGGLAKRFGFLSQRQQDAATKNNDSWLNQRNQIIDLYGGDKAGKRKTGVGK